MAKLISVNIVWEVDDNTDEWDILDNMPDWEDMKGKANWFWTDPNSLEIEEDVKAGTLKNY